IYGGPTMSVSMLSEQLQEAGVSVQVYTTTANGKTELPVLPGVTINVDGVSVTYFKRLTKDHTHFSPSLLKSVWKECRSFYALHLHAWWKLVSLFSCLIALIRWVPVIVSTRRTISAYSLQKKNINIKWITHYLLGKTILKRCHL